MCSNFFIFKVFFSFHLLTPHTSAAVLLLWTEGKISLVPLRFWEYSNQRCKDITFLCSVLSFDVHLELSISVLYSLLIPLCFGNGTAANTALLRTCAVVVMRLFSRQLCVHVCLNVHKKDRYNCIHAGRSFCACDA